MTYTLLEGDALEQLRTLPDGSAQTCITSPPYFALRNYGVAGQIGLEATPDAYAQALVAVFHEVRRVLRDDGTLWIVLGDCYAQDSKWGGASGHKNATSAAAGLPRDRKTTGLKDKDLIGIPWLVAFALRSDGWWLRQEVIWDKPNGLPEPVKDRPSRSHETLFLLSKSRRYAYDHDAIKEPAVEGSRNKRSVWRVPTRPFSGAHYATYPPALITPCVLAGSRPDGLVLDPFSGTGTTGVVALTHDRHYIGIEINPASNALARARLDGVAPLLQEAAADG